MENRWKTQIAQGFTKTKCRLSTLNQDPHKAFSTQKSCARVLVEPRLFVPRQALVEPRLRTRPWILHSAWPFVRTLLACSLGTNLGVLVPWRPAQDRTTHRTRPRTRLWGPKAFLRLVLVSLSHRQNPYSVNTAWEIQENAAIAQFGTSLEASSTQCSQQSPNRTSSEAKFR